uniref:Uncharacterized protein n=1 Tax=Arundo donax TaxID=35708 RepID=A0A0A9HXK6_ARUDO
MLQLLKLHYYSYILQILIFF